MSSPFVFNVAALLRSGPGGALPEQRTQTGPSPVRIGPEMIALPEGGEVTVAATLTSLGEGVLIDADVTGQLHGQCVRCLRELTPQLDLHVSQLFTDSPDFIAGDPEEDGDEGSGDEIPQIDGDEVDLLQSVINEAGLNLPFNPTCEGGCPEDETDVPAPDGLSGEENEGRVDPRWSGLEKFL